MIFNDALNGILNGKKDTKISRISIDLSYSFYVAQLFEMTKYTKPQSLKKQLKQILIKKDELYNLICGISDENSIHMPFKDILNTSNINKLIEQNILFFYNAYPDEIKNVFGDSFLFNNKPIVTLLEEYSNQFMSDPQNVMQTDFQNMINNINNDSIIMNYKKELIALFLKKLSQSNRIIQLANEDDKTLLSLFEMLNELKINSNINDIQYFSTKDLTDQNGDIILFNFFDKTRNAIIHNMIDVIVEDNGQVFYAFQDINNDNKDTNYILSNISSGQLHNLLNTGIKYLELYKEAMIEAEKSKEREDSDLER